MDNFTETSSSGFGENIGNSLMAIIFGFLLIIISMILLSYNENRAINQTLALEEVKSNVISLDKNIYKPEYTNKPIHIQGEVTPIKGLVDNLFNIKSNGLVLQRKVEVYQWKEIKKSKSKDEMGGSTTTVTTYDYVKEWSSSPIDSSTFKHIENHNNPPFAYANARFLTDAKLGEFHLSQTIVAKISSSKPFTGLENMPEKIGDMKNYKSFLYKGENPSNPKVGDTKISYSEAPMGDYSIIAKLSEKELVPYRTQNKKDFIFVKRGLVSADDILNGELDSNSMFTWLLRLVGLILMFIGFALMMSLLVTLANIIPMLGSLVGGVTSIVALIFTLILGSITIAIAWFASRPILSLIIIIVGVGMGIILSRFKREKSLSK